jgi:hypothetical protein
MPSLWDSASTDSVSADSSDFASDPASDSESDSAFRDFSTDSAFKGTLHRTPNLRSLHRMRFGRWMARSAAGHPVISSRRCSLFAGASTPPPQERCETGNWPSDFGEHWVGRGLTPASRGCRPYGACRQPAAYPGLTPGAKLCRPFGTLHSTEIASWESALHRSSPQECSRKCNEPPSAFRHNSARCLPPHSRRHPKQSP